MGGQLVPTRRSVTNGEPARALVYGMRPVVLAVVVLAVAAAPAVFASTLLSGFVPLYDAQRHAAYIAITAVAWGGIALALVALGSRLRHREAGGLSGIDVILGAAALVTLGAWIFSIYQWNITKFPSIELDAVGPTTILWPFLVILAVTLLPLIRGRRTFAFAVLSVTIIVLFGDVIVGLIGALRDGAISPWGLVVGLLYCLELGILATWTGIRARAS